MAISSYHKPPTRRQHKKIGKYLSSNEEVILVTTIGSGYMWLNIIVWLIIPLGFFYFSAFMFFGLINLPGFDWVKWFGILAAAIVILKIKTTSDILKKRQSNIYVVTNRRILIITGLFSRKIVTAPLDRITHITVNQSFIQRILYNTGDLLIITAGFDQREIVVEHVSHPVKFKILVEELTAKSEGKYQESEKEIEETKLRALS
jgi:uncharacterized membrane protein YdbT with pleckstrin-like domain